MILMFYNKRIWCILFPSYSAQNSSISDLHIMLYCMEPYTHTIFAEIIRKPFQSVDEIDWLKYILELWCQSTTIFLFQIKLPSNIFDKQAFFNSKCHSGWLLLTAVLAKILIVNLTRSSLRKTSKCFISCEKLRIRFLLSEDGRTELWRNASTYFINFMEY